MHKCECCVNRGGKWMKVQNAYLDDRLRSDRPITFLQFVDELRRLWEAAGKKGNIVRSKPKDDEAQYPLITYRLLKRLINQDFKDYKPRYRDVIEHPYAPGQFVELYGQIFDVWVEFKIYSLTQEEADELVIEFEDFLQLYAGFFKRSGVQDIRFYAQEEDEVNTDSRVPVAVRTLQYQFRFEKVTPRFLNQIHDLAVQASLLHTENQNEEEDL
jgi:hypothetical protein